LFVGYRAMLARCYCGIGDYHGAARHYRIILETKPSVPVFRSLATCQRLAGQASKARETLEACLREFPHEKGIHLEMAELEAQEANLHEVINELRKEIDTNPDIDRDWKIS